MQAGSPFVGALAEASRRLRAVLAEMAMGGAALPHAAVGRTCVVGQNSSPSIASLAPDNTSSGIVPQFRHDAQSCRNRWTIKPTDRGTHP